MTTHEVAQTRQDWVDGTGEQPVQKYPSLYLCNLAENTDETRLCNTFYGGALVHSVTVNRHASGNIGAHINFRSVPDERRLLESVQRLGNYSVRTSHISLKPWKASDAGALFVKNLGDDVDALTLYFVFSRYGAIRSCKIPLDDHGCFRDFGFVQYESSHMASRAILHADGMRLQNKSLLVIPYTPRRAASQGIGELCPTNCYVSGLPANVSAAALEEEFSQYGEIEECRVMQGATGGKRWFGFVHFREARSAVAACKSVDGRALFGAAKVQCTIARRRTPNAEPGQHPRDQPDADLHADYHTQHLADYSHPQPTHYYNQQGHAGSPSWQGMGYGPAMAYGPAGQWFGGMAQQGQPQVLCPTVACWPPYPVAVYGAVPVVPAAPYSSPYAAASTAPYSSPYAAASTAPYSSPYAAASTAPYCYGYNSHQASLQGGESSEIPPRESEKSPDENETSPDENEMSPVEDVEEAVNPSPRRSSAGSASVCGSSMPTAADADPAIIDAAPSCRSPACDASAEESSLSNDVGEDSLPVEAAGHDAGAAAGEAATGQGEAGAWEDVAARTRGRVVGGAGSETGGSGCLSPASAASVRSTLFADALHRGLDSLCTDDCTHSSEGGAGGAKSGAGSAGCDHIGADVASKKGVAKGRVMQVQKAKAVPAEHRRVDVTAGKVEGRAQGVAGRGDSQSVAQGHVGGEVEEGKRKMKRGPRTKKRGGT